VNHEGRGRPTFLDVEMGPERGVYAEETARQIDTEVKRLITDAETSARSVLMARRELLDQLTDLLLDKEVLEGDDVRRRMGIPAPDAPGDEPVPVTAPIGDTDQPH
jgi:cell division protease FtsH